MGFEWSGRVAEDPPELERDARDWPILHPACGVLNPANRHACVLGDHQGFHRDDTGMRWLDNGL
ncbi:hypothetical protein FB561_5941 [Kribbella amoyensis]|uniref:Uncharacterized protein n=2 Tax=Kribbella amoyensis TaxID=996641 RepID=A0A561C116_9ACTN|nr:hypothetical protein FB561_5941 [Kribbella amoyensis]